MSEGWTVAQAKEIVDIVVRKIEELENSSS